MNSFADDLFWNDVSGEQEHQQRTAALVHSKVAIAPYWAFLSSARSERDFDNRLSLSLSRISSLVAPETLDEVLSSLRDDYRAVTAGAKSSQDDKDIKKNSDDAKDQAEDETGADSESDKKNNQDPDDDDTDNLGKNGPDADSTKKDNDKKNTKGTPKNLDKDKANDDSDTTGKGHWDEKNKTWTRETTGAFVPDPSDKSRYYPPYENLESLPLNNGDLQGSDGFPADLAEGEQRTPEAYARQTTPGTWTQGPGMPERPMPQGVARGYQPVAAQRSPGKHNVGMKEIAPNLYNVACRDCRYGEVTHGRDNADFLADTHEREPEQYLNRNHTASFDKDGFLVESSGDPWAATLYQHRPLNDHTPSGGPDMHPNDHYNMGLRHGELGYSGEGHSIAEPGSTNHRRYLDGLNEGRDNIRRGFPLQFETSLHQSVVDPVPGAPLGANPFYFDQGRSGITGDGFPQDPGPEPLADRANDYGTVGPVSTGSEEGQVDGNGYSRSQPGRQASVEPRNFNLTAADHYNRGFYDRQNDRYYAGEEHQDTEEARTYRQGWDEAHEHYGGHAAADRATQNELFGHVGSTDGRIVDHCPGCDKPRRVHSTAHGDEIRHLHNDHVRCFGKYAAQMGAEPTFKPGDRVISFRGEGATVHRVYPSNHPGKSNRVQVRWDDPERNLTWDGKEHPEGAGDQNAYYENVFSHHPDTVDHLKNMVDNAVPHSDQISRVYSSKRALLEEAPEAIEGAESLTSVAPKKQGDSDPGDTWAWDMLKNSSVGWGHDTTNHGSSWSFQDALAFNGENYTTHFDKEGFISEAADYLGRPDASNPTGRGADEYKARTWDAYTTTRPMQSADDRNVNTPVLPAERLKTRNIGPENPQFDRSRTDRMEQSGDEEDED